MSDFGINPDFLTNILWRQSIQNCKDSVSTIVKTEYQQLRRQSIHK